MTLLPPPAVVNLQPVDARYDGPVTIRSWIFHTAVTSQHGQGPAYHNGVEWHTYLDEDGTVEQLRDLDTNADANCDANDWSGSTETWDGGDPEANPWTPAQIESMKWLIVTVHNLKDVPYRVCRTWDDGGFGYHRMFNQWNHPYHSCPGNTRVAQWDEVIVPFIAQCAAGNETTDTPAALAAPIPLPEDEEMSLVNAILAIKYAFALFQTPPDPAGQRDAVKQLLQAKTPEERDHIVAAFGSQLAGI